MTREILDSIAPSHCSSPIPAKIKELETYLTEEQSRVNILIFTLIHMLKICNPGNCIFTIKYVDAVIRNFIVVTPEGE